MIRRICVVSSSRADYGLLKLLLSKIKSEQKFTLQLVVTGSHLEKNMAKLTRKLIRMEIISIKKLKFP